MRRRTFLAQSTCAAAALGVSALGCRERTGAAGPPTDPPTPEPRPGPAPGPAPASDDAPGPDTMDDALALLADNGPGGGNHAPMGAEALITLGRGDLAVAWVEGYKRSERMHPRPTGRVLSSEEHTAALGDRERLGDWMATFRREVADAPWRDVLRAWAPRLLPGLAGAATHGIIRTSHATRSLTRADTEPRRNELADALGYWAGTYQPIVPLAAASQPEEPRMPSAALADVPLVPRARRNRRMVPSLHARATDPAFAEIVHAARPAPGQEEAFLTDLTATFARAYATHGGHAPIAFIHAVTGPASLRLLLPYLEPADRRRAMNFAWQTAAGLWASFSPGPLPDGQALPASSPALWNAALARAVEGGDVHAIKLAEVCWRESRIASGAAYLAAARDVAARL